MLLYYLLPWLSFILLIFVNLSLSYFNWRVTYLLLTSWLNETMTFALLFSFRVKPKPMTHVPFIYNSKAEKNYDSLSKHSLPNGLIVLPLKCRQTLCRNVRPCYSLMLATFEWCDWLILKDHIPWFLKELVCENVIFPFSV